MASVRGAWEWWSRGWVLSAATTFVVTYVGSAAFAVAGDVVHPRALGLGLACTAITLHRLAVLIWGEVMSKGNGSKKPRKSDGKAPLPAGHVHGDELAAGDRFYLYGTDVALVVRGGDAHEVVYVHRGREVTGLPPTRPEIGWEVLP